MEYVHGHSWRLDREGAGRCTCQNIIQATQAFSLVFTFSLHECREFMVHGSWFIVQGLAANLCCALHKSSSNTRPPTIPTNPTLARLGRSICQCLGESLSRQNTSRPWHPAQKDNSNAMCPMLHVTNSTEWRRFLQPPCLTCQLSPHMLPPCVPGDWADPAKRCF